MYRKLAGGVLSEVVNGYGCQPKKAFRIKLVKRERRINRLLIVFYSPRRNEVLFLGVFVVIIF